MNKIYEYEATAQSVDVRNFSIVSDRKLTWGEILDAICLPNISKEGDCEKDGGITSTFKWTDFGDDSQMEVISGELEND